VVIGGKFNFGRAVAGTYNRRDIKEIIMHEIAMEVTMHALKAGFQIGLMFLFVFWGVKSVFGIVERA